MATAHPARFDSRSPFFAVSCSWPLRMSTCCIHHSTIRLDPFVFGFYFLLLHQLAGLFDTIATTCFRASRSMMMTQSYYGSGEHDHMSRASQHRSSSAGYYDRPAPYSSYASYGYHDPPRPELRPDYTGRPITRALIHETEPEPTHGTARRRIAVAVSIASLAGRSSNADGCTVLTLQATEDQMQRRSG